ncbi:MAG: response regulator [Jaaginema sp. PMC 1079.18]|nr:response regulator [Jaaginema sp. PMC 1080.18]MEC4852943.1 response regulator [Jaaginema sp. PMC 1079.18]MEC4868444.1 response regulator [Jaaginema sp. PMC 1078.18]
MKDAIVQILMIEDDPNDVDLTYRAIRRAKLSLNITTFDNAEEGLAYLDDEAIALPDLILLDLKLPRMSGREFLQVLKNHPQYKAIPVVILTSSDRDEDILQSYNLGVNAYVTKPVGLAGFIKIIESLNDFWFTIVKLPNRQR